MPDERWNRAKQVFHEALDRSGPERSRFVAAACAHDPELRAQVEALLSAHDEAGAFMALPTEVRADEAARAVAGLAAAGPPEGPGTSIGPYKLLQVIGEGGFGVVYMAEQEHPIRRRVALKIIKFGMDTKAVIARFEAERQALAMMDHPNIAKVLDAGATESGRPYFVMELVKGVPITDYCDANRLSTRERLDLFADVCKAIHHAHERGLIHRDIKPSNVMVTLHDGTPVPKIIDFGVAKATNQRLTEKTLFTAYGEFVGTPAYMSPEQTEFSGLEIDRRSDIYSLGVLLYELLTGTTPFEAERLRARAFLEVMRIIREEDPPTPSARLYTLGDRLIEVAGRRQVDPAALAKLVRGDLDWIVMKALEKDRRRRYGSASELAEDLARLFRHEPVTARRRSAAYRLSKFARRRRGPLLAAAGIVVAVMAGGLLAQLGGFGRSQVSVDRTAVALRKVWSLPKEYSDPVTSPDGGYISYYSEETGDLGLHDAASGTDRRLTDKGTWTQSQDHYTGESTFSPDGRQIAYLWFDSSGWRYELHTTNLHGVGVRQTRRLLGGQSGEYIDKPSWSPDGKRIAVELRKNGTSEIGLVSVDNGSLRVAKPAGWSQVTGITGLSFSPNGRHLAVGARRARLGDAWPSDVLVLASDGSGEVLPAVVHPSDDWLMGWSPDGKHILFASDRGGTFDLWALPFASDRPEGTPKLVKRNTGRLLSGINNDAGVLYFVSHADDADIASASINLESGGQIGPTLRPIPTFIGSNRQPDWSPDGKYLAYVSNRDPSGARRPGAKTLVVRPVETGQVRELEPQPKLLDFNWPRWAPDGRSFIAQATDVDKRQGVFQIDAHTGDATPIALSPAGSAFSRPQWSRDGRKVYFRSDTAGTDDRVIERDVLSGVERELLRRNLMDAWSVSPDGRYVAVSHFDRPANSSVVVLIPVDGGEPIELVREASVLWSQLAWVPDGRGLIVMKARSDVRTGRYETRELWLVPVGGGQPRQLAIDAENIEDAPVSVHPEGRQIAFIAGERKTEVWALENYLSALSSEK